MVGGLDRYFQIARCLRDEDLRGDRQFEFMQYDMEMSFAGQADVHGGGDRGRERGDRGRHRRAARARSRRMTWPEAMERFGSDKPDIRFGMELVDLADVVAGTEFKAFHADAVKGICVPGHGRRVAARRSTASWTGPSSSARPGWSGCGCGTAARSSRRSLKFLVATPSRRRSSTALGAAPGDLVLIVAGAAARRRTRARASCASTSAGRR